jgi:hypothetical protein
VKAEQLRWHEGSPHITPVRWIVGEFVTVRRDLHVTLDSEFFLKLPVVFQHGP